MSIPLYKIKIKDNKNTYWFNTENQFINAGGFTSDTSEMGDLIKKKKRELGFNFPKHLTINPLIP